jgi:hypothetical protein
MIADAHFSIRQSLNGKILSELSVGKVVATESVLPIAIRFDLVDKDSPVFAAMPRQISLAVAIDVEPSCHALALNRRLPDGGVDGFPLPLDVAGRPTFAESDRAIALISSQERPKSQHLSAGADIGGGAPLRQGQSPATPPA